MSETIPHFLLMSEGCTTARGDGSRSSVEPGQWRFVLESVDGQTVLEVDELESESDQERLDLIAVVRGLEALDQPSHVTLVTSSAYVHHGFRYGLEEWRDNNWQWERFGQMAQVRNADLWRRVDRALRYHRVDCRAWRFDKGHAAVGGAATTDDPSSALLPEDAMTTIPPAPHYAAPGAAVDATSGSERPHWVTPGAARSQGNPAAAGPRVASLRRGRQHDVRSRAKLAPTALLASVRDSAALAAGRVWHSCRHWLAQTLNQE